MTITREEAARNAAAALNIGKVEEDLNKLIERRAQGADHANAEAERERARDARRTHAVRLVNARAWAAYHGGQALLHHDLAAKNAAKRDEYAALVRELEANTRGGGGLVDGSM